MISNLKYTRKTAVDSAEITTVLCLAGSAITTGDYFTITAIASTGELVNNYVWFDKDSGGGDPAPSGLTGIEVDIANTDTNAQVATKLKNVMDAEANYGATVATATVTITNAQKGCVLDAVDVNTGSTITITTQGTQVVCDNKCLLKRIIISDIGTSCLLRVVDGTTVLLTATLAGTPIPRSIECDIKIATSLEVSISATADIIIVYEE